MKILTYPDPKLREVGESVRREKILTAPFRKFCFDLMRTMELSGGVGLAATQVGVDDRVFVMKNKDGLRRIVINPEWVPTKEAKDEPNEGCLSFPDQIRQIKRYREIRVIYTDIAGAIRHEVFVGLDAQIVQHETEHLDGILFIDHETKSVLKRRNSNAD